MENFHVRSLAKNTVIKFPHKKAKNKYLAIENYQSIFKLQKYNSEIPYQLFNFQMGQEVLIKLRNNIEQNSNAANLTKLSSYEFLKNIFEKSEQSTEQLLTAQNVHEHLINYLNSLDQANRKRRRSYEILQSEIMKVQKSAVHENLNDSKLLESEMQWVEEMQEMVRINITELMSTQKLFKIRQNFRKLVLKLLKIENLWIYIAHLNGRIEFHDFENNFITDIIEKQKSTSILRNIQKGSNTGSINDVAQLLDLKFSSEDESKLYKRSVHANNQKYKICFVWKNYKNQQYLDEISVKLVQKITSITLISTFQEEITVIQNYSKNLLEILQLCIRRSELKCLSVINPSTLNVQDLQKWLEVRSHEGCEDAVTLRANAFQQLKYQLLERIRMYKKYVCEQDKIFMDFDQQAVLAFVSNNISHRYSSNLQHLYQKRKLFIENIFKEDKLINNFMKKALEKKIKHNKIYELDFQTKARVQYDGEGRIVRLHVIVEQTENSSSHSSSNIYCSSSTKNLSDQSDQKKEKTEYRNSALIKNLQKQNPGIINEGWINLFIKDNQVERRNTILKNTAKSYSVKRSYSLNRNAILPTPNKQTSEMNSKINEINVESTDLNLLKMEEEILEPLVIQIFKKVDFFGTEIVNKQCFQNFVTQIHKGYQHHNNPFHNFTHGVNVMQTCFLISTTPKIMELLTPFKIFTIMFSGLCHDVGHTGFTNLFEIASGSKKALTYNDISPLENYHASHTFQILRKPQNNFLKDLSNQEMKEFRKAVISNILYTDIKQHFPLLKKFNSFIKDEVPKTQQFITCLSGMIVHTSDFGGSAKEFQVCKQWSLKVNLEFSNQYKLEGELGLPQTPFLKDLNNPTILSKNQGGFLKVIVLPLYQTLNNFNGTDYRIKRMFQFVENNIKQWQKINFQSQKSRPPGI